MKDFTKIALETCRSAGATYGDIRIVTVRGEDITMKDGNIDVLSLTTVRGFGVRAIADGGWGFAGSHEMTKNEIQDTARLAVRIAKASGSTRKNPIVLVDTETVEDKYETKIKKDPFKVPVEEKLEILAEVDKRLGRVGDAIKVRRADYRAHRENKVFASTEGAYISQTITWCGGGFSCVAVGPGVPPQSRSFPGSFRGDFSSKGYEYFEGLRLLESVEDVASEAIALTQAPACPSGTMTLLLDGHQLMLQIHESCGHPTELDRVLGTEAAYA
ncbi:MAG: TldD/PmbA family protein, partial [Promethearchaeota archaeon]